MFLIFQYLVTLSELDSKDTTPRDLYKMVIFSFDSVILTTHRSKFVQFIILFLCGLDYQKHTNDTNAIPGDQESTSEQFMLSREFAAKLIELVLDPFRPGINRQSAACYLASFVSRSTSVCAETACEAVSALLRFAEAYMDTYPTEAMARNANRGVGDPFGNHVVSKVEAHGLYYTVCQAAFYIICFRGKESIDHHQKAIKYHRNLESSNEDVDVLLYSDPRLIDISTKRWTRIVSHHLNPLKYCLESVRGEFLLLSDRFNLIESEVLQRLIIEDRKMASGAHASKSVMNKPSSIRTAATLERRRKSGGVGGLGRGSNPLDSFFPFDPYLLRRSYAYIDPHYRHWSGSPSADDMAVEEIDNDEIIHEDSSDDEDDEEEEGSVQFNENEDDDSVGDDCVAMSLTSTTCSIPLGEDSDDEVAADDMAVPKDTWVAELKRARALSVEDCW
jgi:RNA polymerase I-specific transcription initiation factor RRN3